MLEYLDVLRTEIKGFMFTLGFKYFSLAVHDVFCIIIVGGFLF